MTGIQTAVRMLEHTLKNLNFYRDSRPKLDCIQTLYTERQKKVYLNIYSDCQIIKLHKLVHNLTFDLSAD